MKLKLIILIAIGLCAVYAGDMPEGLSPHPFSGDLNYTDQVLVFTATNGYRHKSIEKGVATLKELGKENDFQVLQTEDSLYFTSENLKKYKLVIFLSTTQDVLGQEQEAAFKQYINDGGSYMGIHAAADTEYEWPWYGKLVGAYFKSHPKQQKARIEVVDKKHPATAHLDTSWMHFDEWYNYKNINPAIKVIMKLDESSYNGGENGENHPIAWYHEFDGGKAFYTGLGHTKEAYDDPAFRKHLLGGINYCLGR
ncbi:ThuA domain-containing protein [Muriicola sp. Z0-33]|uniref:ThuA domain-containing protein n=1 Tax=Muriicola sp. Z0-33 TaxID=2816957 RepID=UPI0022380D19|nr:ThuA domain-containing protein [Muriicola sp. Z0-33]MCW5516357.1 ThuA domain-containing protein [Muriicola sp. Z0-33]